MVVLLNGKSELWNKEMSKADLETFKTIKCYCSLMCLNLVNYVL